MCFKVIIAGGRDFADYNLLSTKVSHLIQNKLPDVAIISGVARGADSLGAKFGRANGITVIEKPADWNKFGKSAGYRRNEEMLQIADAVIAFWDGKSKGTKHMIDISRSAGIPVRVINY
jgi:YspA, cpYpsA-related SLOG family